MITALETQLKEKDQLLIAAAQNAKEQEDISRKRRLKTGAKLRLVFSTFPTIAIEAASMVLASTYGAGENLLQKVLSFWPYLTVGVVLFPFCAWLIVGKHRLKALGWPFSKMAE